MKFSIIVPIYNVEKYLKECVESLVFQSYESSNYEVILVDDGSTDSSGEIADELAFQYKNVRTIHKLNGGLSDTRNVGIKEAKGEYLLFIDSDDYIDNKDFLLDISSILKCNNYDLMVFGRKKYYEVSLKFIEEPLFEKKKKYTVLESAIHNNFFRASACDKIIKRQLVLDKKLFFIKGMTGEDIKWCGDVLDSIDLNNVGIYNKNVYVYRQREGSISNKVTNQNNMKLLIEMFEKEIRNDGNYKNKIINSYYAYEYAVRLGKIYTSDMKDFDKSYKKRMLSLSDCLSFDISKKVHYINILKKIIGKNLTAKLLGFVIEFKRRRK